MECARCHGLMVVHEVLDLYGSAELRWVHGWKCVNCGHRTDPVMTENRASHEAHGNGSAELITEPDDGHPYYSR